MLYTVIPNTMKNAMMAVNTTFWNLVLGMILSS